MGHPPIEARLAAAGLQPLRRRAWLELDLDALAGNLAAIRRLVGPGVRIAPVVKADAYGHGAVPIARALTGSGIDGLCVATLEEALELRAAGIGGPVLVLLPVPPDGVAEARAQGIALTAGTGEMLDALLATAAVLPAHRGEPLELHLELETGLGRGGSLPEDAAADAAAIRSTPGVRLAGVWSHLAAPDDPITPAAQDAAYDRAMAAIADGAGWDPGARRHLAASGAILAGRTRTWDVIRPGLAIYGIVPDDLVPAAGMPAAAAAALRPVLSLHARPVRVATLPVAHGIGYGPVFTTTRPSRIATLPLGYGDGWQRALTGRADALVRGVRAPVVGRVSMDAITVDVTDVPGEPVSIHDEFVLIGRQDGAAIPVEDVARAATTISYEVTTSMSRRLTRVYHAAGTVREIRTLAGE